MLPLQEVSKIVNLVETENRMVVSRACREGKMGSCCSGVQSFSYTRSIGCRDLFYNVTPGVNNMVLCA